MPSAPRTVGALDVTRAAVPDVQHDELRQGPADVAGRPGWANPPGNDLDTRRGHHGPVAATVGVHAQPVLPDVGPDVPRPVHVPVLRDERLPTGGRLREG